MTTLVFDSDALIKLAKISIIHKITKKFKCIISEKVFKEVVIEGKKRGYKDAFIVENLVVQGLVSVVRHVPDSRALTITRNLGEGEKATLSLFFNLNARFLVSDDERFLSRIRGHVRYLTSAAIIVRLFKLGFIAKSEALQALNNLKPFINIRVFQRALNEVIKNH